MSTWYDERKRLEGNVWKFKILLYSHCFFVLGFLLGLLVS